MRCDRAESGRAGKKRKHADLESKKREGGQRRRDGCERGVQRLLLAQHFDELSAEDYP